MPPAGYSEVITGPARRATAAGRRLTVEPALVDQLLGETAEGADALPLLALTLERLYRDFGADGDLTVAEYEAIGGLARVVQTEVDSLLATDLTGPEIARHLFVSVNTLRTHTKHIFTKLAVNTRQAAVRRATDLGLL